MPFTHTTSANEILPLTPDKYLYHLDLSLTHCGSKLASSDIAPIFPSDGPSVNITEGVDLPSLSVVDAGGSSSQVGGDILPV